MCLPKLGISCIFQHASNKMTRYFLLTCNEKQTIDVFEELANVDLVGNICVIVSEKLQREQVTYNIKFLTCICHSLTNSERQKVLRKQIDLRTKTFTC